MAPDWQEKIFSATDRLFEGTLGPAITDDMRDLCPVFFGQNSTAGPVSFEIATRLGTLGEAGSLRDSIEFHLNQHNLVVSATGSDERSYAYFVETGHRVVVFGVDKHWRKPEQPFIRPAVYQVRSA
jgi:hypothetical protein